MTELTRKEFWQQAALTFARTCHDVDEAAAFASILTNRMTTFVEAEDVALSEMNQEEQAIAASRPIEAIRLMRARTGCTLAYAKEALDRYRGLR